MLMRHGLLPWCITDREHDGFLASGIARQLLLQDLDRLLARLWTMGPSARQGKQASDDQGADR
ncbi:hypothetical protein D3C75_1039840 [compost metagenome]